MLVVFDPEHPDQLLACGEIGRTTETDGVLAIALVSSEGARRLAHTGSRTWHRPTVTWGFRSS